jgi:hypothetical protein
MHMKTTKTELMETINTELYAVLLERYARTNLRQVLQEYDGDTSLSLDKTERFLEDILAALASVDMGIDYLTAALTGNDPASISIVQKQLGRLGSAGAQLTRPSAPSKEEVHEGWAGRAYGETGPEAHEDEEDREAAPVEWPEGSEEEGDLRADTRLGGDWEGPAAVETEPTPRRPPKEYRREAIKILASFNINVGQEAIDILGWELYNKAQSAPTQDMDAPVGQSPWWRRVLKKAIGEDLRAGIDKPLLNEITKEELSAVRYFTQGQPYEVEKLLIQLLDRYGLALKDVEQLAAEISGMSPADINQEPAAMQQIKEELQAYLEEVYSKKQRDFMCAMKDTPDGDRPEGLSKGEAGHLCSAPMEKPKKKGNKK